MGIFQFGLATALAASLVASPVLAQSQPVTLEGTVMLEKAVVDADGKTELKLIEPKMVVPGDRLIFGTSYRNTGTDPVANFVVTNPLPSAVRLAPDADAKLVVSIDGGNSWGVLSSLQVKQEDGTQRAAVPADVTHVRWTLAVVAPGESGRVEFPAIIR